MSAEYAPLQVLGAHSLLRGTFTPEELVRSAVRLGLRRVALTDRNSLMGAVRFVKAARAAGIEPVLGVDLQHGTTRCTVLARGARGYAACCRLVGQVHQDASMDLPLALAEHAQDLFLLCADAELLPRLHGLVGSAALRAAVVRLPGYAPDRLRQRAQELGVACVATGDVHLLRREEHGVHRLLRAIAEKTVLERLDPRSVVSENALLLEASAMASRHRGELELLHESCALAEASPVELELGVFHMPRLTQEEGAAAVPLEELVRAGAQRRYGQPLPEAVALRLQQEMAVIHELNFCDYFLVVNRIAEFARSSGIPFVGRGSAANSLVIYVLGLTRVDPLEHGLVFERFLSRSRKSLPDVDLDFCWRRRAEVLAFVYRTWGAERVALIATAIHLRPRLAFREAATALGLPKKLSGNVAKALPWHLQEGAPEDLAELRPWLDAPRVRETLALAARLGRLPRHLGVHPGGMVIADRPLWHYTPVVPSAQGLLVTQNCKIAIEGMGLVKIDLLGQRSLSTVGDTLQLINSMGEPVPNLEQVSAADPVTAALVAEGRSIGCFQTESPAMRRLLVEMRARTRDDVVDAIALVRPGPSNAGMKAHYVRRARGLESATVPHPLLEPVLRRTRGIMLYQEDILRVCVALAGFSVEEGDQVRAALGKSKDSEQLAVLASRYSNGTQRAGVSPAVAAEVWLQINNFAAFSFCKAHAATYGYLAWEELFLKARYPGAFFCAVLNNDRGYYADRVYLDEARRCGVRFLLPDVNRSQDLLTAERHGIRIGLGRVKGLRAEILQQLLRERTAQGLFVSLTDLLTRVPLRRVEAENLVLCGALDAFEHTRPELLWRLQLQQRPSAQKGLGLFDGLLPRPAQIRVADFSQERKHKDEYALLGLSAAGSAAVFGLTPEALSVQQLVDRVGQSVVCRGWVSASRRLRTKEGRTMRFLSVEDASGMVEAVLHPEAYTRHGMKLCGEGPFEFRGQMELRFGVACLLVDAVRNLQAEEAESAQ
ncbi:MAG: DNA polymerase III subunit alpha [Planctomycetes bacterium]|nr:DNA polymerase III subunit alpha [Planctomycetota bacterium]